MKFKATVYHAKHQPMYHYCGTEESKKEVSAYLIAGVYSAVADLEIEANDTNHALERAFELTNHTFQEWQMNKEVMKIYDALNGKRSTSVGDVILVGVTKYVVASFGFDKLS